MPTNVIPQVLIVRHPREKLSKCTLQPLKGTPFITFHTANPAHPLDVSHSILLAVDAPPLSPSDAPHPLLLLDSTWRLLPYLHNSISGPTIPRSLPSTIPTAYPRVSKIFQDPPSGLASIEALYLALLILGHNLPHLLNHYHWKSQFLLNIHTHAPLLLPSLP